MHADNDYHSNPSGWTAPEVGNAARYSRVYLECGKYKVAEALQRRVRDWLVARLGPTHLLSVRVSLFLSRTLWFLGKTDEALEIQRVALDSCQRTLPKNDPTTLRIMDAMGITCWQRGLLTEAKALHEQAIEGMED